MYRCQSVLNCLFTALNKTSNLKWLEDTYVGFGYCSSKVYLQTTVKCISARAEEMFKSGMPLLVCFSIFLFITANYSPEETSLDLKLNFYIPLKSVPKE